MSVTATIQELLQGIMDSQYGRDMRQFIHDAIQKCYEEGSAGETDLEARERLDVVEDNVSSILGDTAVIRTSLVSNANIPKGSYFIYEGELFKTLKFIPYGQTMVVDTDIEKTTIARELMNIGSRYRGGYDTVTTNANGSYVTVCSIPDITIGTYVITAQMHFSKTVSGGYCEIGISDSENDNIFIPLGTKTHETDGTTQTLHITTIYNATNNLPLYLKAKNGNVNAEFTARYILLKISDTSSTLWD